MSEAIARQEPEADTARVQPRAAQSGPQVVPQPPAPYDVEKKLAEPLDELPKFETHHDFVLTRPITAPNGQLVKEVRLRAPSGMDLFEVGGPPTKTTWGPSGMVIDMDGEKLRKWLGRLANVDIPTLYRASARDIRAMYEWLNGELNPLGN